MALSWESAKKTSLVLNVDNAGIEKVDQSSPVKVIETYSEQKKKYDCESREKIWYSFTVSSTKIKKTLQLREGDCWTKRRRKTQRMILPNTTNDSSMRCKRDRSGNNK